jgi:hypothetical protein
MFEYVVFFREVLRERSWRSLVVDVVFCRVVQMLRSKWAWNFSVLFAGLGILQSSPKPMHLARTHKVGAVLGSYISMPDSP